jgi:hypothetical protein
MVVESNRNNLSSDFPKIVKLESMCLLTHIQLKLDRKTIAKIGFISLTIKS